MKRLQKLDVFPKFDHKFEVDARQRTALGGIFSLISLTVIALLVVAEMRYFISVQEHREMYVDQTVGGEMQVAVNVTFYHVPCDLITLDAIDAFGVYNTKVTEAVVKTRVHSRTLEVISLARPLVDEKKVMTRAIDPDGVAKENCPSCYGAERDPGDCCHTCEDVKVAYARKKWSFNVDDTSVEQCAEERLKLAQLAVSREGCNVYASFKAPRVTGNVHLVPGRMFAHPAFGHRTLDLMEDTTRRLNLSHIIHELEFGKRFPGQLNPLDNTVHVRPRGESANGRFSYFVKIIPTTYQQSSLLVGAARTVIESNQYSVTQHFVPKSEAKDDAEQKRSEARPLVGGVFITYDLSPIKIDVFQSHPYPSVVHFVLQLCAVCGGVLTVAGLVDAMLFHGVQHVKKARQGKLA